MENIVEKNIKNLSALVAKSYSTLQISQNKFSVLSASNNSSNPPAAQDNLLNRLNLPATIAQNKISNLSNPHPATKNTSPTPPAIIEKFSDKELYEYCRFTGLNAREWSKRFVAALPEVSRRSLYLKHGHHTVCEFAAKLGGITNTVVNNVLHLEKILNDKPILKSLIGEIGVNKIRVVASIATKETDAFWAKKVEQLSKSALEVLVREVRNVIAQERLNKIEMCQKNPGIFLTEDGKEVLFEGATHADQVSLFEGETRGRDGFLEEEESAYQMNLFEGTGDTQQPAQPTLTIAQNILQKPERINFSVPITPDTEFMLRKFKVSLEKEKKQVLDWNKTLQEMVTRADNKGRDL